MGGITDVKAGASLLTDIFNKHGPWPGMVVMLLMLLVGGHWLYLKPQSEVQAQMLQDRLHLINILEKQAEKQAAAIASIAVSTREMSETNKQLKAVFEAFASEVRMIHTEQNVKINALLEKRYAPASR